MKKLIAILLLIPISFIVKSENDPIKKRKPVNRNLKIPKVFKNDTILVITPTYKSTNYIITTNTVTGKKDTVMLIGVS
jgi:hypothetical protein